jgi:hypothetical protein
MRRRIQQKIDNLDTLYMQAIVLEPVFLQKVHSLSQLTEHSSGGNPDVASHTSQRDAEPGIAPVDSLVPVDEVAGVGGVSTMQRQIWEVDTETSLLKSVDRTVEKLSRVYKVLVSFLCPFSSREIASLVRAVLEYRFNISVPRFSTETHTCLLVLVQSEVWMLLDVVRSCIVVDTIEEMNHVVKLIVEDQVCAKVSVLVRAHVLVTLCQRGWSMGSTHSSVSLCLCALLAAVMVLHDVHACVLSARLHFQELRVLRVQNRMSMDYDARNSCGYRDILVNLCIHTPFTCQLGLCNHVCELQIILKS